MSASGRDGGAPERVRSTFARGTEAEERFARGLGEPALFALALAAVVASLYFGLGVVAKDALAYTPLMYLAAGVFFVLTMLTYLEASSLHPERGGASLFARYAFDELWSFVAGWAILLDYLIVLAICVFAVPSYLTAFWGGMDDGLVEKVLYVVVLGSVVWANVRGLSPQRFRVGLRLALLSFLLLAVLTAIASVQLFDLALLTDASVVGAAPGFDDLVFAAVIATVACTGIEAASGFAGETRVGRGGLKRVAIAAGATAVLTLVAVSLLALMAVPVEDGRTALGGFFEEAPLLGVAAALEPDALSDVLKLLTGLVGALVLVSAANGQMLGIGRLVYSLGRNRQVPSLLSRLDARHATPYIAIALAGAIALGLALSDDLEFLAGLFAFGAMIAFTLAHLSVIVLRFTEPDRPRAFRVPLNVAVRGTPVPLPAVLGALLGVGGWASVVAFHEGALMAGGGWMLFGLVLYVVYRTGQDKSLTQRFTIPEEALKEIKDTEFGSILVPVFGEPIDDDIVGTAGRLAAEEAEDEGGAMIEALYVHEMPMSLPIDARVPPERVERARRALSRAREVGEEYEGVEVATVMVRGRSVGSAIVGEARRRGVEAIVLAAEEPSRIRGGGKLGGLGLSRDRFAGETTRYVIEKAPCKVILTAPPAEPEPIVEEGAAPA